MQKKGAALRAVLACEPSQDSEAVNAPDRSPEHAKAGETLPARLQFTPVPRRYRHDGCAPERQVAFIEALADTGCVDRAARMVNIAQTNCYALKRAPGAEEFRRAWDAALDCGLGRMKDIAFERAIEGELVPVFSAGKLVGYRRKRNDALLMFCLRHYGQDAEGKRVTVNYFSARVGAGAVSAGEGEGPPPPSCGRSPSGGSSHPPDGTWIAGGNPTHHSSRGGSAQAEASATTVRTVITSRGAGPSTGSGLSDAADVLNGFEGVQLDAEAEAAIKRALEECAARARAAEAAGDAGGLAAEDALADDPGESFFRSQGYHGALIPPCLVEAFEPFVEGEAHWQLAGAEKPAALVAFEEEQLKKRGKGAVTTED